MARGVVRSCLGVAGDACGRIDAIRRIFVERGRRAPINVIWGSFILSLREQLRPEAGVARAIIVAHGDASALLQSGSPDGEEKQYVEDEWWELPGGEPKSVLLVLFGCRTLQAVDRYGLRTSRWGVIGYSNDIFCEVDRRIGRDSTARICNGLMAALAESDTATDCVGTIRAMYNELIEGHVNGSRRWLSTPGDRAEHRMAALFAGLQESALEATITEG